MRYPTIRRMYNVALIEVCDECRSSEGIRGYTIAEDEGRKVRVVLCEGHREKAIALMDLVEQGAAPMPAPRKRASTRKPRAPRAVSMREIEKME